VPVHQRCDRRYEIGAQHCFPPCRRSESSCFVAGQPAHAMLNPPLMLMTWPVIQLA
jgi:hypothetical protein